MVGNPPSVSQLREHDELALLALIDLYYARIHQYLVRLLHDPQIAAELTQEAFLNAFTALPRLTDDSNLSAWLFRIATNLARKHVRRTTLISWVHIDDALVAPANVEDHVIQHDLVGMALRQLPLDYQACLLLHAWAGLTTAEIAQVIGKTDDAVRMTLVRARRRFRAVYDPRPDKELEP
jgi:RNA polymerase sigma-70 factor (ECF subfamily)